MVPIMILRKLNVEHISFVHTLAQGWNESTRERVFLKLRVFTDSTTMYLLDTPEVKGEEIKVLVDALTAFNLAATKIGADHWIIYEK